MTGPRLSQIETEIIGTFGAAFHETSQADALPTFYERHRRLALAIRSDRGYLEAPGLNDAALKSFTLAAFSSYRKAVAVGLDYPTRVARRSLRMLDARHLDYDSELALYNQVHSKFLTTNVRAIHPHLLIVTPDEAPAIDYAPTIRSRLTAAMENTQTGCPAPQRVLERFYERYIDSIFDPNSTE